MNLSKPAQSAAMIFSQLISFFKDSPLFAIADNNNSLFQDETEHTRSERQVLGNINHPFLVRLYYAFQAQVILFYEVENSSIELWESGTIVDCSSSMRLSISSGLNNQKYKIPGIWEISSDSVRILSVKKNYRIRSFWTFGQWAKFLFLRRQIAKIF